MKDNAVTGKDRYPLGRELGHEDPDHRQVHSKSSAAIVRRAIATGLAIASLWIPACRSRQEPPAADAPPSSDTPRFPETPPEEADANQTALPDDVQIYQDENRMFALALPAGYTYEAIANGMTFVSADGGFGGIIQYENQDSEESLSQGDLEARLAQMIESRFSNVEWQSDTQEQSDGSLRMDWKGTNDAGAQLDGLSFIEQHGATTFVLTAYGIDRPYNDYNSDAQIIAGTYVVQENPPESVQSESTPPESDSTEPPQS